MTGVSTELLPCPFCGNSGTGPAFLCEQGRWDIWQVECGFCDIAIEGPNGFTGDAAKQAAIEAWNTRRTPSPATPVATGDDVRVFAEREIPRLRSLIVFLEEAAGEEAKKPIRGLLYSASTALEQQVRFMQRVLSALAPTSDEGGPKL